MVNYNYLTKDDLPNFIEFSKKCKSNLSNLINWAVNLIENDSKDIIISLEWEDDQIVGFLCACTLGCFVKSKDEFLPIYITLRMERLPGNRENSFSIFIDKISRLISMYFEKRNFFQFYTIRRLPKHCNSYSAIASFCARSWHFHPYLMIVESIIDTKQKFDNLPLFFRNMNGNYYNPFVILTGLLKNEDRETRINQLFK